MADIDNLVVTVGGDISGLQSAFDAIPAAAQTAASGITGAFSDIDQAFGTVAQQAQAASDSIGEMGGTVAGVEDGLAALSGSMSDLGANAGEAASNVGQIPPALEQIPPALHDVADEAGNATEKLQQMLEEGLKLVGITAGLDAIKEAVEGSLEAFGEFQRAGEALTVIAGSATQAAEALERIPPLADAIGQSIPDLENATVKFARYGVELGTIPPLLTAISDAARASFQDFDSVASAFERMDNTGKVMARSLQTAGLQMADLAAAMQMVGASDAAVTQAFADLGTGMEGAAARAQVLIDATNRVAGISASDANDVKGSWQQMENAIHEAATNIGASLALLGDSGGLSAFKLALQGIETFIISMIGYVQAGIDALVGFEKVSVDVLTAIGKVAADVAVGDWVQAGVDIKAAVVTIADDLQTASQKMASDWTANGTLIDKVWATTTADIKNNTTTNVGAAMDAMGTYAANLAAAIEKVDASSQSMKANFNLAAVALDAAKQEYASGAITLGALKQAQDAYNSALYAMNPAAQAAAQAAQAFADKINALKVAVDTVSTAAFAALDLDSANAAQALSQVTTQMNAVLDAMQQTSNPKTLKGLQDLVNGLASLQTQLQSVINQQAFQKLGNDLDTYVTKYPSQLAELDQITGGWASRTIAATQSVRESFDNLTDQQVVDTYEKSLDGLDQSAQKLATDFSTSAAKMHTQATDQIAITVDWRTEVGNLTNSYEEMYMLANKYHLNEIVKTQQEITDLQQLVDLQSKLNVSQGIQLDTQAKLLQLQLSSATATGATAAQALAWQQTLTAVQVQQGILKDQTVGLANLYADMVKSLGQAWTDLGKGLADAMVSGQNFGAALTKVFDSLKQQIAELVTNYLLSQLKDAFLQNTNALSDFGKLFTSIFGGGEGGTSGVLDVGFNSAAQASQAMAKQLTEDFSSTAQAATTSGTQIQQSMAQTASSVQSSAASMVSGLSAVAAVVTAIASIFSAIELMHTNTLLDRIEHETARMAIYLGDQGDTSIQGYTGTAAAMLTYIHSDIATMLGYIEQMNTTLTTMLGVIAASGGSGGGGGAVDFKALQQEINTALLAFSEEISGPYGLGPSVQGVATAASSAGASLGTLSTVSDTLSSTLTATAATVGTAATAVATSLTAITKAAPVPATVAYSPGTNTFTPILPPANVPSIGNSGPGGSNTFTSNNILTNPGNETHITVTTNIIPGVVGMNNNAQVQQFSDLVSKNVVTKLQQVSGLKMR